MSQSQWGWIIGGSLFVVALIGWDTWRKPQAGDAGLPDEGTGNRRIGWTVVDTVGTDSSGVTYYVEAYQWESPSGSGNIHVEEHEHSRSYRAARSAGHGGLNPMEIAAPVNTFDEAFDIASDALDRANARAQNPFPRPEQPPTPQPPSEATPPQTGQFGNFDEPFMRSADVEVRGVGTDLIQDGGLLDGVTPI